MPDRRSQTLKNITTADVAAYLRAHPDLLVEHPELLEQLKIPQQNDTVVDMQQFMVGYLQNKLADLKADHQNLVSVARVNLAFQKKIHGAIQALLGAYSFDSFVHIVTKELPLHLEIDTVSLGVESRDLNIGGLKTSGVQLLPEGYIDQILGHKALIFTEQNLPQGDMVIYGAATGLVSSQALMRLQISPKAPPGLLALGSRIATDFTYTQQQEQLLIFLARAAQGMMRIWLALPPY